MPSQLRRHGALLLALIGLIGTAGALYAQAPAADLQALRAEIGTLRNRVAELESRADQSVSRTDLETLKKEFGQLASKLDALGSLVSSQNAELQKLYQDLTKSYDLLSSQVGEQKQILAAISTKDNAGRPIVNLWANMRSDEFQGALSGAVQESLNRYGTLEIDNRMPGAYTIRVNGKDHTVSGYSIEYVRVPVGTLVTELLGYESPKHWTIAPPTYRQRIIIAPAWRVTYDPSPEWVWDPVLGAWVLRRLLEAWPGPGPTPPQRAAAALPRAGRRGCVRPRVSRCRGSRRKAA